MDANNRQIQRNVDADTAAKDNNRRDEPIIALMGCQLLQCDASVTDPNYKNSAVNSEYIAPNQAAFNRGEQQSKQGLTPAQITERNNAAGAPIAKIGALTLGGYVLAPAVAAIAAEAIAFTKNPVAYCAINPVSCIAVVDTIAGTAAGVPVTGVMVPHAVTKGGSGGNSVPKSIELTFDKNTRTWTTPAGIDYGQGSIQGNRVKHVLEHTLPNPSKTIHSVFSVDKKEVLGLVDEAWLLKGSPLQSDPGSYIVPMGRIIGTAGETSVKIIVRPSTNKIITAYPFK